MILDRISADTIHALGVAYLVPDGDCLYIVSHESDWLICITAYALAFPAELVDLISNYTDSAERKYLQWDILCAEVYPDRRQYLPGKAKNVKTLAPERHPRGICAQTVRDHISTLGWALSDSGLDLTDLFNHGYARPVYPDRAARQGQFARDQAQAQQYIFQYQGRVVTVDGDYFRAFYDMGFHVRTTSCRKHADKISHPVIVATIDAETYAFGFMPPVDRSGIAAAPDNRPIYADAGLVSWSTVDEALALIDADTSLFNPAIHDLATLQLCTEDRIEQAVQRPSYNTVVTQETLFAIGVLRWNGVDEASIMNALEARRMPSYQAGYDAVMDGIEQAFPLLEGDRAPWQRNQATEYARKARRAIEVLTALGVGAEPGRLHALEAGLRAAGAA